MTLEEVVKRIAVLAERAKSDPDEAEYLAQKLRHATLAAECLACGELAEPKGDYCAACEQAPTCERCQMRCIDGLADRENGWCESCAEEMARPEREAARREFQRRPEPETAQDARRAVDAEVRGWVQ